MQYYGLKGFKKLDMFSCLWNDGMPSTQEICFPSISNIETRDCLMIHKLKINFAKCARLSNLILIESKATH